MWNPYIYRWWDKIKQEPGQAGVDGWKWLVAVCLHRIVFYVIVGTRCIRRPSLLREVGCISRGTRCHDAMRGSMEGRKIIGRVAILRQKALLSYLLKVCTFAKFRIRGTSGSVWEPHSGKQKHEYHEWVQIAFPVTFFMVNVAQRYVESCFPGWKEGRRGSGRRLEIRWNTDV